MIFLCFRSSAGCELFAAAKSETDHEETKSDSADTGTYPQVILKLIHGFSGIQTHDLCFNW